jgi:hypothetical protein
MGGEAESPGIDATLAFGTASAPLTGGGVLDRPQLISHPKAARRGCPLLARQATDTNRRLVRTMNCGVDDA